MSRSESLREVLHGLPPVLGADARVLILGSMPGMRSLTESQYYAHPRNAFWPIMMRIFGISEAADYSQRLAALRAARVALWDVIGQCARRGSLDAMIDPESVRVNDFGFVFETCPRIERIVFNGRAAEASFRRHVQPALASRLAAVECIRLPSTSPAHAALSMDQKCRRWRAALCPSQPLRRN